jgi:hypothetical protein
VGFLTSFFKYRKYIALLYIAPIKQFHEQPRGAPFVAFPPVSHSVSCPHSTSVRLIKFFPREEACYVLLLAKHKLVITAQRAFRREFNKGVAPQFLTSVLDDGELSASRSCYFTAREIFNKTGCVGDWLGPRAVRKLWSSKMSPGSVRNRASIHRSSNIYDYNLRMGGGLWSTSYDSLHYSCAVRMSFCSPTSLSFLPDFFIILSRLKPPVWTQYTIKL